MRLDCLTEVHTRARHPGVATPRMRTTTRAGEAAAPPDPSGVRLNSAPLQEFERRLLVDARYE